MKKILTLIAAALMAAGATATDYTDQLEVTVNGVAVSMPATISLDKNADGTYKFSLRNFQMATGGQTLGVGNIELDQVVGVSDGEATLLNVDRDITISAGDDPSVSMWMGPMLGKVPVRMMAELRGEKLYTVINIDMTASLSQVIKVTFGNGGYQIPNSGFEDYYTYAQSSLFSGTTYIDEPLHWHSFASCKGGFASFVNGTAHTFQSTDVRPGTSGKKSLNLKATSILGVIANGTVTTGRMNAGAMTATDTNNHAELDMSAQEKDGNGDPFYVEMNGRPDSLALWVKFGQGTPNAAHPYATVSAYITDGTYFQDPQDKEYTNILASAKEAQIESTEGQWRRLSIPFSYVDNSVNGRAILVTISTNADAGQGSDGDSILVDDIALVYNQPTVAAINYKGTPLAGFSADKTDYELPDADRNFDASDFTVTTTGAENARVLVSEEDEMDADNQQVANVYANIVVASHDLAQKATYRVKLGSTATGISTTQAESDGKAAVYNLRGQLVQTMRPGQVYIVRQGGKTAKVAK